MSKNRISIDQLSLACRHVEELTAAGVTENLAIRTLELFADVYAKLHFGGSATPHHVEQVPRKQWSIEAKRRKAQYPNARALDHFRVEHGTPRRAFARAVMSLYKRGALTENDMIELATKSWKLAVITLEEDIRLNRIARSRPSSTPDERWRDAGIAFDENSN